MFVAPSIGATARPAGVVTEGSMMSSVRL